MISRRILATFIAIYYLTSAVIAGPSLVFDLKTGNIIHEDRAGQPWYPASLTKMMTAYIVFQEIRAQKLNPTVDIPVSALAAAQPPSKMGVAQGKYVNTRTAIEVMLVYSANDMAVVLAEAVEGDVPSFARRMNAEAQKLGMTGTHFVTPNGLHDKAQQTTARDMGILVMALLNGFPEYRYIYALPSVLVNGKAFRNRNALLRQMSTATGVKTGYTCNSGFNLAASARVNEKDLVTIVFGAPDWKTRANWTQHALETASRLSVSGRKVAAIKNESGQPPDLRDDLCLAKERPPVKSPRDLTGAAIYLGPFVSAADAKLAATSMARVTTPRTPDIYALPDKMGYIAAIGALKQTEAEQSCHGKSLQNLGCAVYTSIDIEAIKAKAVETNSEAPPPKARAKTR